MLNNAEYIMPGVVVYHDVFPKSMNLIQRLEDVLSDGKEGYSWNSAYTGLDMYNPNYRDCYDYKIKKLTDDPAGKPVEKLLLEQIWDDCFQAQQAPVKDYREMHHIDNLNYWESFNFVKYGESQHFAEHSDHGWSYVSVLSSVGYINDDYEGGGLYFRQLNYTYQPKAGDLVLFPSSYLFSHAAMPVKRGTKYAIVTMLDYHEAPHTPEYQEIELKYRNLYR